MKDQSLTPPAADPGIYVGAGERPLYAGQKPANGLYNSAHEHDACGVGMVCSIKNERSRKIVEDGLKILCNLEHRGAVGADPKAGDGAGILIQLPHEFFAAEAAALGFDLPAPNHYGVAHLFMPRDDAFRAAIAAAFELATRQEGLEVIGWREVPVDPSVLGESVKPTEPVQRQVFIARGSGIADDDAFERKLFVARKVASNYLRAHHPEAVPEYYPVSCSSRTIVYKGLTMADDLARYYKDLQDDRVISALALVHQRFSTNTFPSWPLAHPYRMICHNGEINTLRGNYNWMAARQATMSSPTYGDDMQKLWPISYEGQSDSACRFPMKASRTRPVSTMPSSCSIRAAIRCPTP
jgi:glutamate synthase (NADPH/NADH) large chain